MFSEGGNVADYLHYWYRNNEYMTFLELYDAVQTDAVEQLDKFFANVGSQPREGTSYNRLALDRAFAAGTTGDGLGDALTPAGNSLSRNVNTSSYTQEFSASKVAETDSWIKSLCSQIETNALRKMNLSSAGSVTDAVLKAYEEDILIETAGSGKVYGDTANFASSIVDRLLAANEGRVIEVSDYRFRAEDLEQHYQNLLSACSPISSQQSSTSTEPLDRLSGTVSEMIKKTDEAIMPNVAALGRAESQEKAVGMVNAVTAAIGLNSKSSCVTIKVDKNLQKQAQTKQSSVAGTVAATENPGVTFSTTGARAVISFDAAVGSEPKLANLDSASGYLGDGSDVTIGQLLFDRMKMGEAFKTGLVQFLSGHPRYDEDDEEFYTEMENDWEQLKQWIVMAALASTAASSAASGKRLYVVSGGKLSLVSSVIEKALTDQNSSAATLANSTRDEYMEANWWEPPPKADVESAYKRSERAYPTIVGMLYSTNIRVDLTSAIMGGR